MSSGTTSKNDFIIADKSSSNYFRGNNDFNINSRNNNNRRLNIVLLARMELAVQK